jgi:hypothetical protein
VYPCIGTLKYKLLLNVDDYKYTKEIRRHLIKRVCDRFGSWVESDVCLISTLLDPQFGIEAFKIDKRDFVIERLKFHLDNFSASIGQIQSNITKDSKYQSEADKPAKIDKKREDFYLKYKDESQLNSKDVNFLSIQVYIRCVSKHHYNCALKFWQAHESTWPKLALVAKKFLSVPASSAAAERMFSIAGNIFDSRRRRMSSKLLQQLVFLKLNENLL